MSATIVLLVKMEVHALMDQASSTLVFALKGLMGTIVRVTMKCVPPCHAKMVEHVPMAMAWHSIVPVLWVFQEILVTLMPMPASHILAGMEALVKTYLGLACISSAPVVQVSLASTVA